MLSHFEPAFEARNGLRFKDEVDDHGHDDGEFWKTETETDSGSGSGSEMRCKAMKYY